MGVSVARWAKGGVLARRSIRLLEGSNGDKCEDGRCHDTAGNMVFNPNTKGSSGEASTWGYRRLEGWGQSSEVVEVLRELEMEGAKLLVVGPAAKWLAGRRRDDDGGLLTAAPTTPLWLCPSMLEVPMFHSMIRMF